MGSDAERQWTELGASYRELVADSSKSSAYLREVGLKPIVLSLLGDCSASRVLDVGTGNGWLFDVINAGEAHACDFVRPERIPNRVTFRESDATSLPWPDKYFDVVVSNLMLCYVANINEPLREMARVAASGARLVLSLVHPYFYRTGIVNADESMTISADLSRPVSFEISVGNRVGPFRYFYRPYPDYVNAIVKSGWRICEVLDSFLDGPQYKSAFPHGDDIMRSGRVPLFTFFSCTVAG